MLKKESPSDLSLAFARGRRSLEREKSGAGEGGSVAVVLVVAVVFWLDAPFAHAPTDEPEARTPPTTLIDNSPARANERGPDAKDFSRSSALLALFLKKDALTSPRAREEKW